MTPSPPEVPLRSSRPARMPSPGSPTPREQSPETKPCAHHAASVEPSGDDGEGPARHRSEGGPERYHRRSRIETKMHCVKLLGQRLAARDFDRQVAEFQIRVVVLNGFTALGMPFTQAGVCPGKGEPRPSVDLCNRVLHLNTVKILLQASQVGRFAPYRQDFGPVYLRTEAVRALFRR